MPIRVELVDDAINDLESFIESGNINKFLAKLVRLEEVGADCGEPLSGGLATFRKIVVGNRDWRIIFQTNRAQTVATIWVIGDRSDSECYETALARINALGETPKTESLAAMLTGMVERRQMKTKRRRR